MERLTIPDEVIPGGLRRAVIDAREVKKEAMAIYWRLKRYEDTGLEPENLQEIDEEYQELAREAARLREKERWIPVEEKLPEDDSYIMLSFKNFPVPSVGRYETDQDGGAFYLGDDDKSCISWGAIVNAWKPLPERYQEEE